jgi:hypothetical protein
LRLSIGAAGYVDHIPNREEEDQEAARGGIGRRAGKRIRGIGVGSA